MLTEAMTSPAGATPATAADAEPASQGRGTAAAAVPSALPRGQQLARLELNAQQELAALRQQAHAVAEAPADWLAASIDWDLSVR